ncbi:MAG: signal recognition particle-docking protein FtsY [Kiritimatiellae bacterium]|nr:signal recognition particle-docking protein FtsY [Kiritimatiellia bacterium]
MATSWWSALARTRDAVLRAVGLGAHKAPAAELWPTAKIEEALYTADVAPAVVADVLKHLGAHRNGGASPAALAEHLTMLLPEPPAVRPAIRPRVRVLVGTNGSGKTTTCAKLARRVLRSGGRPLLCAADTFRAAGSAQLQLWADRLGCEIVAGATGADPAAVAFDAVTAAVRREVDELIVDTAGRMHTRLPLMQELQKLVRSIGKAREGAPDDCWLVLDASLGRNALSQASAFRTAVPLTGVVITKLDGSAKAGFVFSLGDELGIPVLFAGLGEGEDDLAVFDRRQFVLGLLGLRNGD